jgi:hypothetical protein
MNSAELAQHLIDRAKNLQEFIVTKKLPSGFTFGGRVPFDMWFTGSVAEIKVFALDAEEANKLVDDWLKERTNYDGQENF